MGGWFNGDDATPPHFTEPGGGGAVGQINVDSGGVRGNAVGAAGGTIKRVVGYAPHMIEAGANDYLLYPMPITAEGTKLRYDRLGGVHWILTVLGWHVRGLGGRLGRIPGGQS